MPVLAIVVIRQRWIHKLHHALVANKLFVRRKREQDVAGWPGVKKYSALIRVYTIHVNIVEFYHFLFIT